MILDTVALSAFVDGNRIVVEVAASSPRHHIPVIVLGEYQYGVLRSTKRARLEAVLGRIIGESEILAIDVETAAYYASIRHDLRRRGGPIPANDLWIAALSLQHGLPVVSRDTHYDLVKGLKRIGW